MSSRTRRSGFTVIELTISIALLGSLMLVYMSTVDRSFKAQEQAEAYFLLRSRALSAMSAMREDLGRAGYATAAGTDYPGVFQTDEVGNEFPAFAHAAPLALHDEDLAAPNTDLVFVLPDDADGDGWPDLTAAGEPAWSAVDLAYLLTPDQSGLNVLKRYSSGGATTTIARGVLWVDFDTPSTSAFEVPLGCMRVRLALGTTDGGVIRETYVHEMTVRLRNGGLL